MAGDVTSANLQNVLFLRLVAKGVRFTSIDFRYSIFETCYIRNCTFDSCDFTGCRFIGTNLYGSTFVGCKFDYAYFERTIVDDSILDTGCPGYENLKMRFARTLRMNYQQLGDARSVNKAIGVELNANEVHLRKAWSSTESYYRHKYHGWGRLRAFLDWVGFKILDFVWGNGESALKLVRAVIALLIVMSVVDVLSFKDPMHVASYGNAILEVPQIFVGALAPSYYPTGYLTLIALVRLVAVGFLVAIIVKRFNRR